MNSRLALVTGLAGALLASALVVVRGARAAQTPEVQALPTVSRSAASEDGRELFKVIAFEPWEGAGRRVVMLTAVSISNDGLVALDTQRFCDVGSAAEPLTLKGHRFQCALTFGVQSWTSVDSNDDVTLTVTAAD